jgi:transposase
LRPNPQVSDPLQRHKSPTAGRWVDLEIEGEPHFSGCGVRGVRVHSSRSQRVRDIPVGGEVSAIWRKRRRFCDNTACGKRTFSEATAQVPAYARSTGRLREALVAAVTTSGRAASEVAAAFSVSWWLVQTTLTAAAALITDVDTMVVRRIGIDEHRFRRVRYFRLPTGKWRRHEPWMSTIVDLDTGRVLGVVDGRNNTGVGTWLAARPAVWRERIEVVAIDPSAAFAKAIRINLPAAAISVDAFHLIKLANDTLTTVRQRLSQQNNHRRGRVADPSWANRRLLLRGADTLSPSGWTRLKTTFATDDPTRELAAAWGVKEQLRRLLACTSLTDAHEEKMRLGHYVQVADMADTDRLWNTLYRWWPAIEVLLITGVTNAKTEAANTGIKNIKRTARGFRNEHHYTARILLTSAARSAA